MFFYNIFYYSGLFVLPIFFYFLFLKENNNNSVISRNLEWYHFIKKPFAERAVKRYQKECKDCFEKEFSDKIEFPKYLPSYHEGDTQYICGSDTQNNVVFLKITFRESKFVEGEIFIKTNDKIYVFPNENKVVVSYIRYKTEWSIGGLRIWVLEPFKRLRIVYNGFLRDISTDEQNVDYVQFRFIWNCSSEPMFYPQNFSTSLLTDDLSREEWKNERWPSFLGDQKGYEQYGALIGYIGGAKFQSELPLHIPSFRKRYYGTADNFALKRDISLFVVSQDGSLCSVGAKYLKFGCKNLRYGSVHFGNNSTFAIKENDIFYEYAGPDEIMPKNLTVHFSVENRDMKCIVNMLPDSEVYFENTEQDGWIRKHVLVSCIMNGEDATGMMSFWYQMSGKGENTMEFEKTIEPSTDNFEIEKFVLPFTESACKKVNISGGKGSSLAILSSIQTKDFTVPAGFVIVSDALNFCIEKSEKIQDCLKELGDVCSGKIEENVSETCDKVVDLISKETIPENIRNEITEILEEITKKDASGLEERWAVRSSGTLEDSEEFSTAGQNATFLGCRNALEIFEAISKCWASLFAFQSVEYRRNHGLPIISDMAVVVQKMVPSDSSGVIFTCHPTTSDTSQIVITSNFGLGESVVSGQVDPDTYVLSKTWTGEVSLLSKNLGGKKSKIVMSDVALTSEISVENAESWSLTIEQVMFLGNVSIYIEKMYGSSRDIEWSFYKGKLYLLQCRPVTTLVSWSDYELTHENDSPVLIPEFIYTKANVGEVMPGAFTILSQDYVIDSVNISFQFLSHTKAKSLVITHQNVLIDIVNTSLSQIKEEMDEAIRGVDLAIFGHFVVDERMHHFAKKLYGTKTTVQLLPQIVSMMKDTEGTAKKAEIIARNFTIPIGENDSSSEIVQKIKATVPYLNQIMDCHGIVSRNNVFYQIVVIGTIAGKEKEISEEVFRDILNALTATSDALSAGIPKILEEIVNEIKKENFAEEFLKIDPEQGLEWLKNKSEKLNRLLENFLQVHGHRAYKEFDLSVSSWGDNPSQLVKMLQANCRSKYVEKNTQASTVDEIISKLVTVNSSLKRSVLKYLIKKCRKTVGDRERTKCELIRALDKVKKAIRILGNKMVRDGVLPSEDFIYHLSFHEIEQVIKKENLSLVSKAIKRKRLFPQWNSLKFPEIMRGVPEPLENKSSSELLLSRGGAAVKGTPVYPGEVVARACVIRSIDLIDQLQNGDILITYSTDIGWSPYFPMLSGVVTELGGLISHGAVVAREYGLPCIVGVENATEIFRTGDEILLSGKEGIVRILSKPEEKEEEDD